MKLTAEEFIREKVRSKFEVPGEMKALYTYYITGDEALRWAHEFASLDKWIGVETLPTVGEHGEKVLIWRVVNEKQELLAYSVFDTLMVRYCDKDTFWQPLPKAPNTNKI